MKLLFITRKYPPMVGGMENLSHALATEFPKLTNTTLISWNKSQKYLPLFLPLFFFKSSYYIVTKKLTHVHLGDALLAPLGLLLKKIFKVRVSTTVCGLDITYKLLIYQAIVPRCVAQLDKIICISQATLNECLIRRIPNHKIKVIPCGVYPGKFHMNASREDLEQITHISLKDKKVLITVGRLVKRKGVYWFIENVFPKLDNKTIYLVVGNGPEKERIENLVTSLNLDDRILLLGRVSDIDLKVMYNTADAFVMPNINVDGDIEGFGIVAIEASSTGLPVIATPSGGIKDAIENNKNGMLIHNNKEKEWIETLKEGTFNSLSKESVKQWTIKNYDWSVITERYYRYINA